jgi:hypothetical protein
MSKDAATSQVTMPFEELNENDVFFGRGNTIATYPGNLEFRRLVWSHRKEYERGFRYFNEKREVVLRVIDHISKSDPPGRFVELVKEGRYILVSRKRVLVKVGQALRDTRKIIPAGHTKAKDDNTPTKEAKKRTRVTVRSSKRAASSRNKKTKTATNRPPRTPRASEGKTMAITSSDTLESKLNGIRNDSSPVPSMKTAAAILPQLDIIGTDDTPGIPKAATEPISGHIDNMFSLLPPHLTVFFTGIFSHPSYVPIPTPSNESKRDIDEIPGNHNSKCVGKLDHHLDLKSPTTVFDSPMPSTLPPPLELTHSLFLNGHGVIPKDLESSAHETWKEWSSNSPMDLESPTTLVGVPTPEAPPLGPIRSLLLVDPDEFISKDVQSSTNEACKEWSNNTSNHRVLLQGHYSFRSCF